MVIFGGLLRFSQEFQSNKAAEKLRAMVSSTATVCRQETNQATVPKKEGITAGKEIAVKLLVSGDIILLSAGAMIPADVRLIATKDLFLSQSTLTGESLPAEKHPELPDDKEKNPLELVNLCFMGTSVVSGSGTAVVAETGSHTYLASLAKTVSGQKARTSFDKGVNGATILLVRFMMIMAPLVFVINGVVKGNWIEALTFALSVAVGLAPEMLPVIVTANLAKGAIAMSDKKVIVKNIDAIQDFGSMNILCTDKTGTLTQDKIVLQRHLDPSGQESVDVLKYAYLNSFYQTGLKNLLDVAVLDRNEELKSLDIEKNYQKFDEIPFDFVRRRMSVIVEEMGKQHILICKGAVEEVLKVCTQLKVNDKVLPIDESVHTKVANLQQKLNSEGLRVIAVAYKVMPPDQLHYAIADEKDLVLLGNIAFLDPPKDSAAQAIKALKGHGVDVKIITGDNEVITQKICKDVGMPVQNVLLGSDIESLFDYATYALMWFVFGANLIEHQALFQTGWFVESLMTQTLIVHVIRTAKVPFFQSRASLLMLLITATVMAVGMYLPFSPIAPGLGFVPLPAVYFLWLFFILTCYCVLTQFVKTWFVKKYSYT